MTWGKICPEHWKNGLSITRAQELFKKSVSLVEIEPFSYCNRRCWFCPNSKIDRHSQNFFMKPEIYSSILNSLAQIDYDETISYSRYNEPLADRKILDFLKEARDVLPKATLRINTNGDYITRDYLDDLYDAGLRKLCIQVYLQNDEKYTDERIRLRAKQLLEKLDLPYECSIDRPNEWLQYRIAYRDAEIYLYGRNFDINGTDRGGLVDLSTQNVRTSACLMPVKDVYIDYNSNVMPCCNVRSDSPEHKGVVLGSISSSQDVFSIYAGKKATQFRSSTLHFDEKKGVCKNCNFACEQKTDDRVQLLQKLKEIAFLDKNKKVD